MQSTVTVYVLFKGWGVIHGGVEWCSMWSQHAFRGKREATSLRSLATWLDLKLVGSGFMVSCYSIILLSAALFGVVLECVRWYIMCHCSSNLGFSSVEHSVFFCFFASCAWFSPLGENIAHPLFFLSFLFSLFFFCDSTLLRKESNTSRFWCSWLIFRRGSLWR